MSGYGATVATKVPRIRGSLSKSNRVRWTEERTMKLSFKQKIRNWLFDDGPNDALSIAEDVESPSIQSNGFRLNVYGASGGTIIETTRYDRKHDENRHSLHVVTDDKDLGSELSKIITMEQLKS
jgi:hypothetical protein